MKVIPCSTKKLAEPDCSCLCNFISVLLTMENTIFKLVLWDRARDPAGSYERSNITVGLSLVSEHNAAPHIL